MRSKEGGEPSRGKRSWLVKAVAPVAAVAIAGSVAGCEAPGDIKFPPHLGGASPAVPAPAGQPVYLKGNEPWGLYAANDPAKGHPVKNSLVEIHQVGSESLNGLWYVNFFYGANRSKPDSANIQSAVDFTLCVAQQLDPHEHQAVLEPCDKTAQTSLIPKKLKNGSYEFTNSITGAILAGPDNPQRYEGGHYQDALFLQENDVREEPTEIPQWIVSPNNHSGPGYNNSAVGTVDYRSGDRGPTAGTVVALAAARREDAGESTGAPVADSSKGAALYSFPRPLRPNDYHFSSPKASPKAA